MIKKFLFFSLLTAGLLTVCQCSNAAGPSNTPTDNEEEAIDWAKAADASSASLVNNFFNPAKGCFNYRSDGTLEFNYWPQAHALDVLVDAYERTHDAFYKSSMDSWFNGVPVMNGGGWWNQYYDDMEWIGLACLRANKATGEAKWRDAALEIWDYIKVGWNDNAGGGITWKKGMEYSKNACSNGPAAILAARLYQEFGDEANKEWALKIYNWEKSTLVSNGAVYDNINSNTGEIQKNWIFTYNEGTYLGAAVELYKISGEKSYLNDALKAADYSMSALTKEGILKDEGSGDGGLFKGILVRYMTQLIRYGGDRLAKSDIKRLQSFLEANAKTLWTSGRTASPVLFGTYWKNAPSGEVCLTEQTSGCMLIEAMALLSKSEN